MTSSDIPNTAPPSENSSMKSGIVATSIARERCVARTSRRSEVSTAPVCWSTANAPPTRSTNAMIGAASGSMNPRIGAWSTMATVWSSRSSAPSNARSTYWNEPGTTTSRVPAPSTTISAFS